MLSKDDNDIPVPRPIMHKQPSVKIQAYRIIQMEEEMQNEKETAEFVDKMDEVKEVLLKKSTQSGVDLIFSYSYTALYYAIRNPLCILSVSLYVAVRILVYSGKDYGISAVAPVDTPLYVMGFMAVFFSSQSFTRYFAQYFTLKRMHGRTQSAAMLARRTLPRPLALKYVRYTVVAQLLAFVGLNSGYTMENFFFPIVHKYSLLTEDELEHLIQFKLTGSSVVAKMVFAIALDIVNEANITNAPSMAMQNLAMESRGIAGDFFDYQYLNIPFLYVQLVEFSTAVAIPLFTISLAATGPSKFNAAFEFTSFLVIIFVCLFFTGLVTVGQKMQDPFGLDPEDFALKKMCDTNVRNVFIILEGNFQDGTTDEDAELQMADSRRRLLGPGVHEVYNKETRTLEKIESSPTTISPLGVESIKLFPDCNRKLSTVSLASVR
jgi:hypothetical protein